jgi:hypothetical protein
MRTFINWIGRKWDIISFYLVALGIYAIISVIVDSGIQSSKLSKKVQEMQYKRDSMDYELKKQDYELFKQQ